MGLGRKVLLAVILNLQMINAWSAGSGEVLTSSASACISLGRHRAAAIEARDWSQLERLAEEFIRTCKNLLDTEDYAAGYQNVADASLAQNSFKKALSASESCISIYYSNTGCHLTKVQTLIELQRLPDAKAALDKADRLIDHVISTKQKELITARTVAERELAASSLKLLSAEKRLAASLRTRHFSK